MINLLLARLSDLFLTDLTAAAGHQMLLICTSNLAILQTHCIDFAQLLDILDLKDGTRKIGEVFCMAWQGIHT